VPIGGESEKGPRRDEIWLLHLATGLLIDPLDNRWADASTSERTARARETQVPYLGRRFAHSLCLLERPATALSSLRSRPSIPQGSRDDFGRHVSLHLSTSWGHLSTRSCHLCTSFCLICEKCRGYRNCLRAHIVKRQFINDNYMVHAIKSLKKTLAGALRSSSRKVSKG
jgi:hypothetical protein